MALGRGIGCDVAQPLQNTFWKVRHKALELLSLALMIAFITIKSSLVPLIEGLCALT